MIRWGHVRTCIDMSLVRKKLLLHEKNAAMWGRIRTNLKVREIKGKIVTMLKSKAYSLGELSPGVEDVDGWRESLRGLGLCAEDEIVHNPLNERLGRGLYW